MAKPRPPLPAELHQGLPPEVARTPQVGDTVFYALHDGITKGRVRAATLVALAPGGAAVLNVHISSKVDGYNIPVIQLDDVPRDDRLAPGTWSPSPLVRVMGTGTVTINMLDGA